MSDDQSELKRFVQEANRLDVPARIELYYTVADEMISSSVEINTKQSSFLKTLPYLIIGAFDAKDIPCTKRNLQEAFEIIIDKVAIEYGLYPVEYSDEGIGTDAGEGTLAMGVDFSDEDKARAERMLMALSFKAESGEASTHDRIKKAVINAIRSDLNLSKDTSGEEVLREARQVLTKAVGQIIDLSFPDATQNQNHAVWDKTLLSCILGRIHEVALESALNLRPRPTKTIQPESAPQPAVK